MSRDAREFPKFDKEMEDLEVADLPESNTDDKKCDYGGFTNEAYEELVRFHRNKEIPKRLHGHLKHRIDCFKRKAKRFQLIEGTDQLIYIGFKPDQSSVGQFVVKKGDVEKILAQAHLETNHGGLNATRKMVSTKFYWNSITNDVEQFIKQCPRCRITRLRYVASNNVPWRKTSRFGDIYAGSGDGSEDDYGLFDRFNNRTWGLSRNGEEYIMYAQDGDVGDFPPQKRIRPVSDVIIGDEVSSDDIDVENDVEELAGAKVDTEMFLPQYFRVRPAPSVQSRLREAEMEENGQVVDYDEAYDDPEETYYEDEFTGGDDVGNGEERLLVEDGLDESTIRPGVAKAVFKEKVVESSPFKRRYTDSGRECIIETDKKYFMVDADQILQLFKRCSECGEKLKQVTLYADPPMPMVAYQCSKCEPAVWFGQKVD